MDGACVYITVVLANARGRLFKARVPSVSAITITFSHILLMAPPGGDPHLGGDDWDVLIADWLATTHLSRAGLDPASDPGLRNNVRALAEAAKRGLSDMEEVTLRWVGRGGEGGSRGSSEEQ